MPKIATTTLNQYEYRMVDGFYLRNGFSLVQDKYCTETGLPIFVNKRANGKWGYCDNDGTDFYVEWTFNLLPGPFDDLPPFRKCVKEGCGAMILSNDVVPMCDTCGDHCATCGKVQDSYHCRQSGDIYCDDCYANRRFLPEPKEEEEEEDSDDDVCNCDQYDCEECCPADSEFMCELVDCATCKRPTMRKDMYWKQGGCVMTEFCEPCHKAKIPDDMMVVPRYIFENEKGELVKWCLCVMKL